MPSIKFTLGADYTDEMSVDVAYLFDYFYDNTSSMYGFTINSSTVSIINFSNNRDTGIYINKSGFLVDFSDNISKVHIDGGELADVLRGGSGNDVLNGGSGNDLLEGGIGNNTINGGAGVNTVSYEHFNSEHGGITVALYDHIAYMTVSYEDFRDTLFNIQNIRGSALSDQLVGDSGNNVIEGGAGSDTIDGSYGIDTASYINSSSGVTVNLLAGAGSGGDAEGDFIWEVENLFGSTHNDILTGNAVANTLTGNGGSDTLYGMAGNDRLVITDTPTMIDGGSDKDFLFVSGGGSVTLTEEAFTGIEVVYVRNDTHLDMSAVTTGSKITSQSTDGHDVEIIGTSGADKIRAGKGGDAIEGGSGGDKLFAGSGSDTFHFQADFGRDNVYGFNTAIDHITVDIAGVDATDLKFTAFHGGQDTIVTFAGVEGANKIILHDVTVAQIEAGPSDLFTFGA